MSSSSRKRSELYESQHGLCFYCFRQLKTSSHAVLEHAVPKSKGGGNGDNIVLACPLCDKLKNNFGSPEEALRHCQDIMRIFDRLVETGKMRWGGNPVVVLAPTVVVLKKKVAEVVSTPKIKISMKKSIVIREESYKYDWASEKVRGSHLTLGKKVPGTIGLFRTDRSGTDKDLLCQLLAENRLTGQALEDAKDICFGSKTDIVSIEAMEPLSKSFLIEEEW